MLPRSAEDAATIQGAEHVEDQVSGVLMGIAEEFGWPVLWVRLAVVAAMWAVKGPWPFFAYLILDVFMQPHIEDRVHMWRFRIARWFRSRNLTAA
jgi:phage shock protein PspC (stress-responsive transcriptional regulator)